MTGPATTRAADVVRAAIAEMGLQTREQRPGVFDVTVPGERKLQTSVALEVRTTASVASSILDPVMAPYQTSA